MTDSGLGTYPLLIPADVSYPAAALTSGPLPGSGLLPDLAGNPQPAVDVGRERVLPAVGSGAALVDLTAADRLLASTGLVARPRRPQVWVAPGAPGDLLDRFTRAGLTVTGDTTATGAAGYRQRQGPGLALRYHALAAALAVAGAVAVLLLVAGAGRGSLPAAALRTQGVPAGKLRRAARVGAALPVLGALLLGPAATALAWASTRTRLPTTLPGDATLPGPGWPGASALLLAVPVAGLALLATALLGAYGLGQPRSPDGSPWGRNR